MCKKLFTMMCVLAFLGGGTMARADLQEGLVAHFHLDEDSGTSAADASGNENHGTLVGPSLEWLPGYDGGCLGFAVPVDADVSDRLEFPTTGMSAMAGTVSVWGYLTDPQPTSRGRYIFGHTTLPRWGNRIQFYMQEGSAPSVSRYLDVGLGASHATKTNIMELPMNEWTQLALSWDNGAYAVYVNGEKVANGTYTGLAALNSVAHFGNDGSSGPYEAFGGMLDEARVYNRAVTAAEVKEIFQAPASPRIKAWGPSPADGAKDVTLGLLSWKSLGMVRLHDIYVGTDPNLTAADLVGPRTVGNVFFYALMQPGTTYYWRVDEIGPDMVTRYPGDVWSFLAQPYTAYDPSPADGTNTASPATELKWLAGIGALTHHVYFGDDPNAVAQATAETDKGTFKDPNFSPGELQAGAAYYWRVDEIGPGDMMNAGAVWSFATVIPVDDFESYTDDVGGRVFQTWIDGFGYTEPAPGNSGNGSGAMVGYAAPPFAEQAIVHGGTQSMPLDYNNVNSPWYSEAERTFATAQDWTAGGVDTLVLYVRAGAGNAAGQLYVALKDTSNQTAVVVCPDAAIVTTTKWTEWKISLADFAGVSLNRVKAISIGVGDRANPAPGGAGRLYIDDIGLAIPSPAKKE